MTAAQDPLVAAIVQSLCSSAQGDKRALAEIADCLLDELNHQLYGRRPELKPWSEEVWESVLYVPHPVLVAVFTEMYALVNQHHVDTPPYVQPQPKPAPTPRAEVPLELRRLVIYWGSKPDADSTLVELNKDGSWDEAIIFADDLNMSTTERAVAKRLGMLKPAPAWALKHRRRPRT